MKMELYYVVKVSTDGPHSICCDDDLEYVAAPFGNYSEASTTKRYYENTLNLLSSYLTTVTQQIEVEF